MKNKYFEQLQEDGLWDEIVSDDEVIPADPEEDASAVRKTVLHVLYALIFLTVTEELLCLFLIGGFLPSFSELKLKCMIGLLSGSVLSFLLFLFMKKQIEEIVELDEKSAKARIKLGAIARILLQAAFLAAALFTGVLNPVAAAVGLLNLKFAVLLQPLLDKVLKME